MSLLGPSPWPLESAWQRRRFSVKPGITCLRQINGCHDIDLARWTELDLQHSDNWSLSLDFDILLKTVPAVLKGALMQAVWLQASTNQVAKRFGG